VASSLYAGAASEPPSARVQQRGHSNRQLALADLCAPSLRARTGRRRLPHSLQRPQGLWRDLLGRQGWRHPHRPVLPGALCHRHAGPRLAGHRESHVWAHVAPRHEVRVVGVAALRGQSSTCQVRRRGAGRVRSVVARGAAGVAVAVHPSHRGPPTMCVRSGHRGGVVTPHGSRRWGRVAARPCGTGTQYLRFSYGVLAFPSSSLQTAFVAAF
jgi:hypothetical protein